MLLKPPSSFVEAIEALENIAELEDFEGITVIDEGDEFTHRAIAWMQEMEPEVGLTTVRQLFRLALGGIREMDDPAMVRELMATVAEAAQKLDRLATLLYGAREGTVTHLPEYRALQRFYRKMEVTEAPPSPTAISTLEQVKSDTNYELGYLKHEHGESFLRPELVENIKLAVDFGEFEKAYEGSDPLIKLQLWIDRSRQDSARQILRHTRHARQHYRRGKGHEQLEKALMALRLAASPKNLLEKVPTKACHEYFADFLGYLRGTLRSDEYQHLLAYPPKNGAKRTFLDLVQALCVALYTQAPHHHYLIEMVRGFEGNTFSEHISADYAELCERLRSHPSGPLMKMFDLLNSDQEQILDMLMLGNLPEAICDLQVGEHSISLLRIPSPTTQEYITHADVSPEFRAFAGSSDKPPLLINLQDRMSWREGARTEALEHCPEAVVVSLAMDSDFYHQRGSFRERENAEQFMAEFYEQMAGDNHGYHFPPSLREELFPEGVEGMINSVHQRFFGGKGKLTRRERLDFIEVVHLCLVLDLIGLLEPGYVSLTCKDSVDTGAAASAALYAGLQILRERPFALEDEKILRAMLLAPAILFRERAPSPKRIQRLVQMLQRLERSAT